MSCFRWRCPIAIAITLWLVPQLAYGQATVGYNSLTSVVGAAVVDQTYRQRVTDQYVITGVNVEPNDGGSQFDRNTVWKIHDQSQPWSLTVRDEAPTVDSNREVVNTKLVQAGRRESAYAVTSAPLNGVIERRVLSPFSPVQMPAIIPVSTTVFPENLGNP